MEFESVWFVSLPVAPNFWLPSFVVFEENYSNSDRQFVQNIPNFKGSDVNCIATPMGFHNPKRVRVFLRKTLKETKSLSERQQIYKASYEAIKTVSLEKPKKDEMMQGYIKTVIAAESYAGNNLTEQQVELFLEGKTKALEVGSVRKRKTDRPNESVNQELSKKKMRK